ncbi:MAG: hypothetical protein CL933_26210 [Deltaproteobacteria bacterium]|nr:hypothetical protein [Deltaproteobacteria bacterium]
MIRGCGRSGTSIFGELFDGLRPYRYASEPPFEELASKSGSFAVKVPVEFDGYPTDPGLSFPLDVLLADHPDIVLLWVRASSARRFSSLRVGIAQNWSHHPRPPAWNDAPTAGHSSIPGASNALRTGSPSFVSRN